MADIKFCGLKTHDDVAAARRNGARWLGFVHFPKSPRDIDFSTARDLIALRGSCETVAVVVDPSNDMGRHVRDAGYDGIQLHGHETPERAAELKKTLGLKIIKAIPVAEASDLEAAFPYVGIVDALLFDAKPPKGSERPGGLGHGYDYGLLKQLNLTTPWLLSGGLNPANVRAAIRASGALAVDVSSGIEQAPGVKSTELMDAFANAVKS